ncbi:MAG: hypothetical protein OEZ59_02485 [Deltaproteobacteria bacterium]|nr:hypothetical protein [Deltaproteobacteria bacterium]
METLADTWVIWLILTIVIIVGLVIKRKDQKQGGGLYQSADDFSVKVILFGFKKGEGDLFLGYTFAILTFSLFIAGFLRWIFTMM